ncbi:cell surface A33 antigen-like, partial [Clarias magur]
IDIITYYYTASGLAQENVSHGYVGRASVQTGISQGVATLKLQSLTSRDSRVYQCDVKIPGDTQGKFSDTTTVMVW